jgi:putative CocE/NonD family hydrolase
MGSETGTTFRNDSQRRFFAHWLKDEPFDPPEALVFETGSNRWRKLDAWPPKSGVTPRRLYLREGGALSFDRPTQTGAAAFDEYVSDPANPVPYRRRPVTPTWPESDWPIWLVLDQRFVAHRPDVLTWQTDVLDHDIVVAGDIMAELHASTSGTDSDWVVKLIDVLPDGPPPGADAGVLPEDDLRGYELMISSDIFRARYRSGFDHSVAVPADTVVEYDIDLHTRAHAFRKGHRIMVQVQSTWFPLYDRNPQKFVPSIYLADDSDYVKATQRIARSAEAASAIVLPIDDAASDPK